MPDNFYDRLARHYDSSELGDYARASLPDVEKILLKAPPPPGRWVDLGCGTGSALDHDRAFHPRRFGLDLSDGMLRLARRRGAKVVRADVRRLPFSDASFALATALFDVANHMLTTADLERFLGEAARVLVPGGAFVFDTNSADHLRLWHGVVDDAPIGGRPGAAVRRRGAFDEKRGIATVEFELAAAGAGEPIGRLHERAHPAGLVESALRRAGFVDVVRTERRKARGRVLRHLWFAKRN